MGKGTDQVHFGSKKKVSASSKVTKGIKPTKAKTDTSPNVLSLDLRLLKSKFDEVRVISKKILDKDDRDIEFYNSRSEIFCSILTEVEDELFEPLFTEAKEREELARLMKKYGYKK